MTQDLIQIKDLCVSFGTGADEKKAVDEVSLSISSGKTLGLVGESGSGKSMTALALMGLLPSAAVLKKGELLFEGKDLRTLSEEELRHMRGARLSMIFQEPFTCMNPVMKVGAQIAESVVLHQGKDEEAALKESIRWLDRAGIQNPEIRAQQYPHQFSGGMRQRAMIAMALACGSRFLIADEPTTALDVTIQAQILDLLDDLRKELNLTLLLISHDLGVIHRLSDDVAVMKDGKIVERGSGTSLFKKPEHSYTKDLVKAYLLWAGEK